MAGRNTRHEHRSEQSTAVGRPPADRSYGDRASDHVDPQGEPDPQHPDTGSAQEGYDATAESTATTRNPRTPSPRDWPTTRGRGPERRSP
ncbi:hypothetical protein [Kitasatospora sp. NPDC059571]|uniref:hypothetical protein n=1 Tax=Kitasatospora sp. NPDC059571 TaxID=3346871 RepID=UPI0036881039